MDLFFQPRTGPDKRTDLCIKYQKTGPFGASRIISSAQLSTDDFDKIASTLSTPLQKARKMAFVSACRSQQEQEITTFTNGIETINQAQIGDWIVTSLNPDNSVMTDKKNAINQYIILPEKFSQLYQRVTGENRIWPDFLQ